MMELHPIHKVKGSAEILYKLLQERTPEQSISHKKMPTMKEHLKFIFSEPYEVWYLIEADDIYVGSIYLTRLREVGIFIFKEHQHKGYAIKAVTELKNIYPGDFLANVSPQNKASIEFFEKLGAKHIQNVYSF